MVEWSITLDCKSSARKGYEGSNPSLSTMDKLFIKLQNIPLVKKVDLKAPNKSGSLFFGVGLMTSKQMGVNLPFDILGMFFAAELIRKTLSLDSALVILGDTHAISNQLLSEAKIKRFADKIENELNKIVRNFALLNFVILRASKFHNDPEFQKILNSLPLMNNEYLRLEIADCLWIQQIKNL